MKRKDELAIPKPERRHRPKRNIKVSLPEEEIQGMAEEYCELIGVRFFRIPTAILGFLRMRGSPPIRNFVSRYFAGLPDMMLFRQIDETRNEVLFLEIKTEAGKLSLNQRKWHSGLHVKVTYGWEETQRVIREFAGLTRGG